MLIPFSASGQTGKATGKLREPFQEPDLGEKFSQPLEIAIPRIDSEVGEVKVIRGRSRVLHARGNIYRVHVADPEVVEIVQFNAKEFAVIGLERGATTVTVWMEGEEYPITMLVRSIRDPEMENIRERDYGILEARLNEVFPNSHIRLVPMANKVLVMGQARDAQEASQIITIVSASGNQGTGTNGFNNADPTQTGTGFGNVGGFGGGQVVGAAAEVFPGQSDAPASLVVNMLHIPGEQTVMLKVKICELNRSALRDVGVDFALSLGNVGQTFIESLLSGEGNVNLSFDSDDVNFTIRALASNGTLKILAEPTLLTLSGYWASFLAGGEFAVPTVVGITGAQAVTTQFRGFGVNLDFLPTVLDKDRIRLVVAPEFSQVNTDLAVNGVPGLNTRTAFTTVDLRAGQSYAIAGLIQDTTENENNRIPYLGDIPFLGTLFSNRHSTHNERELIVIVTPELVAPMEPDEVPPLPGYDVTEPTDCELYFMGRTEGHSGSTWRSTVWPINWTRIRDYIRAERTHVAGPSGHTLPEYSGDFEDSIGGHGRGPISHGPPPYGPSGPVPHYDMGGHMPIHEQPTPMRHGPMHGPSGHGSPARSPYGPPSGMSAPAGQAPMQGANYAPRRGNEPSANSRWGWQRGAQVNSYR